MSKIAATFKITGWEEQPISEHDEGGKLTRAHVTKSYTGDLQGEGVVEYLMAHKSDESASFVGYESVSCVLADKSGSFVFEHQGTFVDGVVTSTWTIVPGSGTGALSGIRGKVSFLAGHRQEYPITITYEL